MSQARRFIDSYGFEWNVFEVPDADARRLYFLARGVSLVLRDFPADWDQLAWDGLEDLCARADAVWGGMSSVAARPVAARAWSQDPVGTA